MSVTVLSAVLVGNPVCTGKIELLRGSSFELAVPILTVAEAGGQALNIVLVQNSAGTGVGVTNILDGDVTGVSYIGESGDSLFVKEGSVQKIGVVTQQSVTAGVVTGQKSDSIGSGFVAGVALGLVMAR